MARHNRSELAQIDPPPARESAQARALRVLREWISNGHYALNQTLPSEKEMAMQIRVSRGTLRAAIRKLKNEGLLQTHQGRRHVVASTPDDTLMSSTIVLLCGADEPKAGLHGAAFEAVDSGVYDTARGLRRNLLTLHVAWLKGSAKRLLSDPPYGVIISEFATAYGPNAAECNRLLAAGLPVVVHSNDARWAPYDRVVSDHADGARRLTQWLLKQGRKRILRLWTGIGDQNAYWVRERNAGYEAAMRDAGLEPLPVVDVPLPSLDAGFDVARYYGEFLVEWVKGPHAVDAIMANTDSATPCAAAACHRFGKRPNEDIAIAGYDNNWADLPAIEKNAAPGFPGPVVSMDKLNYEVGQELTRLLLDRAEGTLPKERQLRSLKPKLVIPI